MEEAILTSKGRLTLPKTVRDAMGVGPGDKIRFVPAGSGYRLVALKGDITAVRGMLEGRRAKPLTVAEMNQAISKIGSRRESRR